MSAPAPAGVGPYLAGALREYFDLGLLEVLWDLEGPAGGFRWLFRTAAGLRYGDFLGDVLADMLDAAYLSINARPVVWEA